MTSPQRFSLAPIFLAIFIDMLGVGIALPVTAPMLLSPDATIIPADASEAFRTIMVGCVLAAFPFAAFFGGPILGAMSDKYGRKKVLILSLTGTLIGYLIFALGIHVHSLALLFLSRLIDGFTGGNIPVIQSAIADISNAQTRAKNFGLIGMAFGLGFILGPYIGGKLSDPTLVSWFDFKTPFLFAAAISFINILLLIFYFRETLTKRRDMPINALTGFRNIRQAFTDPQLRVMFLAIFFCALGFNFFAQFFQVYLIKKFSFTQGDIGDYFAFVGICIAVVQGWLVRKVAKYYSPQQVLHYSLFALGCVLFSMLLPTQVWQVYLVVPFMAIAQGLSAPNMTSIVSESAPPEAQGNMMGINQSVSSVALTIPPVIAAFADLINIHLPIILASCFLMIGWRLMLAYLR
ncbi:MAG: MFS transporter [Saprospiraceae bacterium]|nr:MFS transporter [Saprospiraceae bacterium]MBP7680178.1 MFS transporter [Saprospiraceae bacterium]